MAELLVSFCNVFPRGLALGLYDFDSNTFRWIDLTEVGERVAGVTGTTFHNGRYWCLAQLPAFGVSSLVALDHDLHFVKSFRLEESGDAHSLMPYEDGFLVNDTQNNRLVSVRLGNGEDSLHEVEYWRYCGDQTDVVHVNSIAEVDGDVFVSMFGPKQDGGWRQSQMGKIVNASSNAVVCENLVHPHSLANVDGILYWLESGTGDLHRFTSELGHEIVTRLGGYVRGIAYNRDYLYIAASAARRRSRSTGTSNQTLLSTPEVLNSWIYRVNRKSFAVEKRRLTALGAEIYDLLLVQQAGAQSTKDEIDPVVQRVWKCEDEFIDLQFALERQLAVLEVDRDGALKAFNQRDNQLAEQMHHVELLRAQLVEWQVDRDRALDIVKERDDQIAEKSRHIQLLENQLAKSREDRDRGLDVLREQDEQLAAEVLRTNKLRTDLAAQVAVNESLKAQVQAVCQDLNALRRTRTVRVSRAVGIAVNRILRICKLPI